MRHASTTTISTAEFLENFEQTCKAATSRSIGIEDEGAVRVMLVPAHEYGSLRKLLARALHADAMSDIMRELTGARPGPHPQSPERYDHDEA